MGVLRTLRIFLILCPFLCPLYYSDNFPCRLFAGLFVSAYRDYQAGGWHTTRSLTKLSPVNNILMSLSHPTAHPILPLQYLSHA